LHVREVYPSGEFRVVPVDSLDTFIDEGILVGCPTSRVKQPPCVLLRPTNTTWDRIDKLSAAIVLEVIVQPYTNNALYVSDDFNPVVFFVFGIKPA
jgi:hypothetical protein